MTIRYYYTPRGGTRTNIASAVIYYTMDRDMVLQSTKVKLYVMKSFFASIISSYLSGDSVEIYSDVAIGEPENGIIGRVDSVKEDLPGILILELSGYDCFPSERYSAVEYAGPTGAYGNVNENTILAALASELSVLGWRNTVDGVDGGGITQYSWRGYHATGRRLSDCLDDFHGRLVDNTLFKLPLWCMAKISMQYATSGSSLPYRAPGTQTAYTTAPSSKVHVRLLNFKGTERQTLYRKFCVGSLPGARESYMDYCMGKVSYDDNRDAVINDVTSTGDQCSTHDSTTEYTDEYGKRSYSYAAYHIKYEGDLTELNWRLLQRYFAPVPEATFYAPNIPYGGDSKYADNWPHGYMQAAYVYDPNRTLTIPYYQPDAHYLYGYIKRVKFDSRSGFSRFTIGFPAKTLATALGGLASQLNNIRLGSDQSVRTGSTPTFAQVKLGTQSAVKYSANRLYLNADADDTSGTVIGGYLINSNNLMFKAYKPTGNQPISANTWLAPSMSQELYDTHSAYSTSSSRFAAPVSGYYLITAQLSLVITGGGELEMEIKHGTNGGIMRSKVRAADNNIIRISDVTYLAAGESIWVQIYSNTSGNVAGGQDQTFFSAFLLSGV